MRLWARMVGGRSRTAAAFDLANGDDLHWDHIGDCLPRQVASPGRETVALDEGAAAAIAKRQTRARGHRTQAAGELGKGFVDWNHGHR